MKKQNSLQLILEAFGIDKNTRPIGHGNYSRAYLTKRGTILKFTIDETYMAYIDAVTTKPNDLAPEILNNFGEVAKVLCEDWDGRANVFKEVPLFAVELPKYKHVWSSEDVPNIDNLHSAMGSLEYLCSYNLMHDNWSFEENIANMEENFTPIIRAGVDMFQMFDFINMVHKLQDDLDAFNDMHSDNFMWDAVNNRLVVTDPIGSRSHRSSLNTMSTKASRSEVYSRLDMDKITQICDLLSYKKVDTLFIKFAGGLAKRESLENKRVSNFNIEVVKSPMFRHVRKKIEKECIESGLVKNDVVCKLLNLDWRDTTEIMVEIRNQRAIMGLSLKGEDE